MSKELLTEVLELSIEERIELAQDIWDSITPFPQSLNLTSEQKSELRCRIETYRKGTSKLISWEDLKAQINL